MRFAYASGSRPLEGYTIKRGIGVGGFGEVYFALSDAGKEVALKRIQRNLDIELRGVRQCLNLKHANLVALYDIKYDAEGQAWVVMEYVCGESLKDVLDRNPNGMPPREVQKWFAGIAAGVACLHDHGIVHRDLKPGNIFIDEDVVKIGDYGLSKYISCSRRSGQTESVGTFHYMAPEIGKGVYGKEIDVYALGIILFEMLTGRVPFEGESSQEIIMKHLTAEPDLTGLPEPYRAVIRKALFKDPAKRFVSVADMVACFESPSRASELAAPAIPPVRTGGLRPQSPMYIGAEAEAEGIYLGPVKDVVPAEIVATPRAAAGETGAPPEPIAMAVRDGWRTTRHWWRNANLSAPAKLAVLGLAVLVLIFNSNWLVPLAITFGCVYLIYFGVRSLVLLFQGGAPRTTPVATAAVVAAPAVVRARPNRCQRRRKWRDEARAHLSSKTYGECLGELCGSLLMSAVVVAVAGLLMLMVAGRPLDASVFTWTFYAWFCLTSVAGAWLVLALNKCWESREGEPFRRRFVMLIGGLVVGLLASGLADFLDVRLTDDLVLRGVPTRAVSENFYQADGTLKLPAFLVYFGLLFVVFRWWLQADPLRTSRLSIWGIGVCALGAWILHLLWPFPQPWGFMLAATTSLAVQLSAPWMSDRDRAQIREKLQQV